MHHFGYLFIQFRCWRAGAHWTNPNVGSIGPRREFHDNDLAAKFSLTHWAHTRTESNDAQVPTAQCTCPTLDTLSAYLYGHSGRRHMDLRSIFEHAVIFGRFFLLRIVFHFLELTYSVSAFMITLMTATWQHIKIYYRPKSLLKRRVKIVCVCVCVRNEWRRRSNEEERKNAEWREPHEWCWMRLRCLM